MSKISWKRRSACDLTMLAVAGACLTVGIGSATAADSHSNSNTYPFGKPSAHPDFQVPSPPQEPNLVPTITTKTTTRLYGGNPFQQAVAVTQHLWPAARKENAPGEMNNVPDRPWAVTLVTPDKALPAITATPLIHFPDDAPILFVKNTGIPKVTLDELKRLGDTGIGRDHNVDAFLVGGAANSQVEQQLKSIGMKYKTVTASSVPKLADKVDKLYGSIQHPLDSVPTAGNASQNVMIGSMDAYKYVLPATHWVAHMAAGLLWVNKNSVPKPTIEALKRRDGHARMYLFGGSEQISDAVAKTLSRYGAVIRVTNNNEVAFNKTPTDNPVQTAVAFAKMWDPVGQVGWSITGPGHGFTLVNIDDWQGAVASAPLSHLGFHAPLLMTSSPTRLSSANNGYLKSVAPTFLQTPAEGPYNMTYFVGDWKQLSWPLQAHVDYISEMHGRRVWNSNTGSRYSDSAQ